MFAVFADRACAANIYTHEFMHVCMLQKGCYLNPRKPSNGISAKLLYHPQNTPAIYGIAHPKSRICSV